MNPIYPQKEKYDIVLVNTPCAYYDIQKNSKFQYNRSISPLGLGYIGTYLINNGYSAGILDAEYFKLSVDEICKILSEKHPEYIGMNCFGTNVTICHDIIDKLCELNTTFVIGGVHLLSNRSEFTSKFPKVISVAGFGEKAFLDLVTYGLKEALIENFNLNSEITDIIIDRNLFVNNTTEFEEFSEAVCIGSRGCFNHCYYCITNQFPFYQRDIGSITDEIEYLHNAYGVNMIHFLDDIVFPTNNRLNEFVLSCKKKDIYNKFMWRGLCSLNNLKKFDIKLLESSNCHSLAIGLESGSDRILERIGKNYSIKDIKETLARFINSKVRIKAFFMIDIPEEEDEDIAKTKELILWLKESRIVQDINVFQYKPYQGTRLFNQYYKNDLIEYEYFDLRNMLSAESFSIDKSLGKDFYFTKINGDFERMERVKNEIIEMTRLFYNK